MLKVHSQVCWHVLDMYGKCGEIASMSTENAENAEIADSVFFCFNDNSWSGKHINFLKGLM